MHQALLHQRMVLVEIVESCVTANETFDRRDGSLGTRLTHPAGQGWRIKDHDQRKAKWTRRVRLLVPMPTGRATSRRGRGS